MMLVEGSQKKKKKKNGQSSAGRSLAIREFDEFLDW